MLAKELIQLGSSGLKQNNIISHQIDAELILGNILQKKREDLIISSRIELTKEEIQKFNSNLIRRIKKEPIAYILNRREFWKDNFFVDKNALIPRPETELLIEKISKYFKNSSPFILDVGTGSGCIVISLLKEIKSARAIAIDISPKALKIALRNAVKIGVKKRIKFLSRSIDQKLSGKFDIIVSNPPYIQRNELVHLAKDIRNYEPKIALDGGNDGLDVIKKVIYKAKYILKINGMLALEIGNKQHKKVSQILEKENFRVVNLIKDYKSNVRCIISKLKH